MALTEEAYAGALGGVAGVLCGHPLDTLRVRQQQPGAPHTARAVLVALLRSEGAPALFKGLSGPLVSASAQNAVCFHSYAASTSALSAIWPGLTERPLLTTFFAGCVAGGATAVLVVPVDLLKTQLQVASGSSGPRGPLALAASIVSRHGPTGLYKGAAITFARDVPSSGVYFAVYDVLMRALHADGGGAHGGGATHATVIAGGAAGVASWASIYPLDVAKSRIQAHPERWTSGWVDCLRRSVADEGPAVLWRGLGACLTRAFVVNAAIFSGYEAGLKLCRCAQ